MSDFPSLCEAAFTRKSAKTDEEYRRVLRGKCRIYWILVALGVVTGATALLAWLLDWGQFSDHTMGFYTGVGVGLIAGGVLKLVQTYLILRNPEKLHRQRMEAGDERRGEIARRALGIGGVALLIAVYLVGFIGGIFYPILFQLLLLLVMVFSLTYLIAWGVLNKTM